MDRVCWKLFSSCHQPFSDGPWLRRGECYVVDPVEQDLKISGDLYIHDIAAVLVVPFCLFWI